MSPVGDRDGPIRRAGWSSPRRPPRTGSPWRAELHAGEMPLRKFQREFRWYRCPLPSPAITMFIWLARTRNGIEVAAEDLLLRVVAATVSVQRFELFRRFRSRGRPRASLPEPAPSGGRARPRGTRPVPHAGSSTRSSSRGVEDGDDETDRAARREVLAAVAAQVGADDLLVGGPLRIDVDAAELVLRQLRDHEGEGAVREADLLAALEDGPVLLLHLGEERRDAFSDLLAAGVGELRIPVKVITDSGGK